jgi:hypothetical protein
VSVRDSLAFISATTDPALGQIIGIEERDYAAVIENLDRQCFVASCYTDRKRVIGERYRKFFLIIQNSYLLGFFDNLGLAWLHHLHHRPIELVPFTAGLPKKFVAEQLYRLGKSEMARVLFVETMLAYEPAWRTVVLAKDELPALAQSSRQLTRIASDFFLSHEIGHAATNDSRYDVQVREPIAAALAERDLEDLTAESIALLREEAEADRFGTDNCIAIYAQTMSDPRLRQYLKFVVQVTAVLNILYSMTDHLHQTNVDERHRHADLEQMLLVWAHREAIACDHIDSFNFSDTPLTPAPSDTYLDLGDPTELFDGLRDFNRLTEPPNEHARRMAMVLDLGLSEGEGFEQVINAVRSSWMLTRSEPGEDAGQPVIV